jgi:hypothetical protein
MWLLIAWTALSLVIGAIARTRGDSFPMAFLSSMLLTPLVGFALVMLKLPNHAKGARQSHLA